MGSARSICDFRPSSKVRETAPWHRLGQGESGIWVSFISPSVHVPYSTWERPYLQRYDGATVRLSNYGARSYAQDFGWFIQPDSVVPSPGDPQSLNRYACARGNPLKYVDPTGHSSCEDSNNCLSIDWPAGGSTGGVEVAGVQSSNHGKGFSAPGRADLSRLGGQLKGLQVYIQNTDPSRVAQFYYDEDTPLFVISYAEHRLGVANVLPIPPIPH